MTSLSFAGNLFDNFYFFGDSLSDIGNLQDPNPPQHIPITNGDYTWASYFSASFGMPLAPSIDGGNDWAVAGDQTGQGTNSSTGQPSSGMLGQVSSFLSASSTPLDSHALYSIWGGANDLLVQMKTNPTDSNALIKVSDTAVNNIATMLTLLHNAGARYFMVLNLPDLGKTPEFIDTYPQYSAGATAITDIFNGRLATQLQALPMDIIQLDINSLFHAIILDPGHFGFTNVTDPMSSSTSSGYLFYNSIHPTEAGHEIIADYARSVLAGPLDAAILADVPFSVYDAQNSTAENQLYSVRTGVSELPNKAYSAFASTNYTPSTMDADGTQNPGYNAYNTGISAGVLHRFNPSWVFGADLSRSWSTVNFGQQQGSFDLDENIATLFASYQYYKTYIDGVIGAGVINYNDINRNIPLGISQNVANADTTGWQTGANVLGGYNFLNNALKTGPVLDLDYQYIQVNPYTEENSVSGTNLQYFTQYNQSFTSGIGWQGSYTIPYGHMEWMPYLQAMLENQWIHGTRNIKAGVASLPGTSFTLPAQQPSDTYGLITAGIMANIWQNISAGLSYQTTLLTQNVSGQNISLNIQMTM
jgi:outer membrane lipase/esterase